ncbi:MAG: DNA primase [bacterium]|nr:DNA primase [bacterium]
MSQLIPEETIQEVLLRADIVDVLSEYVNLKKGGANYKGLCPFHNEKTPSFTVSPAKGLYYCFGCQASGNVARFLMQHENLAFPDAVRLLATRYGVNIPETASDRRTDALKPFYALHQAATNFFHQCLLHDSAAQQARTYCRERQLSSDIAARFALGYAPDGWDRLGLEMQRQGFSEEMLVRSGLVVVREHKPGIYDRFRNRLMFPIYDRFGRPIAFGGRHLDKANALHVPKYLNSPETPIFHKGRVLYGFHLAKQAIRQQQRAIMVEGYTDVIACHRHDVTHVVGTLGTALTERHVEMLRGLAKDITLVFDSDAAGGAATERGIGLFLEAGVRVRVVELPAGEDPDSFLRQRGQEAFLQYVDEAITFVEYLLLRAKRFHDVQTPTGQADCVARILPLLRKVENQVEQWGYMTLLAEKIGLPVEVLQREMRTRVATIPARVKPSPLPAARQTPMLSPVEYGLVRLMLHDRSVLDQVRHQITVDDFQEPILRSLYELFLRLTPKGTEETLPNMLEQAGSDTERQLLAKMATEAAAVAEDSEAQYKALEDHILRLQQQRLQARLRQLKASILEAEQREDTDEQQRLLQAYTTLRHEKRCHYQRGQA